MSKPDFSDKEQAAIHRLFRLRRDVRRGFTGGEIGDDTLVRILSAAHFAPSVGFMQPWNFIVIRSKSKRESIHQLFENSRQKESEVFTGDRQKLYKSLKLEGILESTLNICVTCDRQRQGETGLGRSQQNNMDLYSSVCAVQNLWLAARAEEIGVGWVSILDKTLLAQELGLPEHVEPVAYLCVGPVDKFAADPELERVGWDSRRELESMIYSENWGQK